jgi:anti-sigma28 factor (negative regulator of flagellin synthesis)
MLNKIGTTPSAIEIDSLAAAKSHEAIQAGKNRFAGILTPQSGAAAHVSISDATFSKLAAEKELSQFSSIAFRGQEAVDTDKVERFKALIEQGQIGDYLNSLDFEELAGKILKGPTSGAFSI